VTNLVPAAGNGMRLPSIFLPSTTSDFTPLHFDFGFETTIEYSTPRNLRWTEKPFHYFGMQGSMRRPLKSGFTPRIDCEATTNDQAPVPVSQEFLPSPGTGANCEDVIWA